MASRTAIYGMMTAASLSLAGGHRAAAQPPVTPPDPTFTSPLLTPPEPYPRGGVQNPNLPPAAPPPAAGVPFPGVPPLDPAATGTDLVLPNGAAVRLPSADKQVIQISPRYGNLGDIVWTPLGDGYQQAVYTGGIIVNVTYTARDPSGVPVDQEYEFATDNLVMWVKGLNAPNPAGVRVDAAAPAGKRVSVELYMKGNVVIRNRDATPTAANQLRVANRVIRADEIYYDVDTNRAVALNADLELLLANFTDPVHFRAKEIQRLGRREWRGTSTAADASRLPSDPSVRLLATDTHFVESDERPVNIFGIPYRTLTGEEVAGRQTLTARNARVTVLGIPVFYTPFYRGDLSEPIGPLLGLGFANDVIFGAQFYTSWDIHKLLAVRPPPGHRWRLDVDYLGTRGVGHGTDYSYRSPSVFGFGGRAAGGAMFYGIEDRGEDQIGFRTPVPPYRPDYRFRARWRHQQELFAEREPGTLLPTGWTVNNQSQFAWLSDKNFLEQYFLQEYTLGPNQETFTYFDASRGNLFGSVLVQGGERRDWLGETRWLPRGDAAVVGRSFFDLFVYNARAHAAYAEALPAVEPPLPDVATDRRINTGRFGLQQELSLPFDLGPVRLAPYGVVDTTAYTNDLTGESVGRLYGGGGVRASATLSRLYPDVSSELFDLSGLNHKVTPYADYFAAESNVPYTRLPFLDRLNDDSTDVVRRTTLPFFPANRVPPREALALQTSPVFDPQRYAIRRRVDNRVDTLDDLQVVRVGVDQRLQTKRGFPGARSTVDWMVLNMAASLFPDPDRDNFGKGWAFLEYNFLWNVGDRTALQSAGWFDPFDPGVRYYTVGAYLSRPNQTNLYIGYRQTDPLQSKAVVGSVVYPITRKYSVAAGFSYDFGVEQALGNALTLIRTGTDLTVSLGVTYNPIVENFGVQFTVVPNVVANTAFGRGFGSPQIGGR